MTEQFTLELPDSTLRILRGVAARTGRKIEVILGELIEQEVSKLPMAALSETQLNVLIGTMMSKIDQEEPKVLLGNQQED